MNRSGWRSRLVALGTALIACIYLLSLSSLPALATVGSITEFSPASLPRGITAGPDGNLWFTEYSGNKIGRLSMH
jgi:streptogramin lyase